MYHFPTASFLRKKYRKQGYMVIEEPNKNGHWQTRIKW